MGITEKEIYKIAVGVQVSGDEQAKKKLKALDSFIDKTEQRAKKLNRIKASPDVRIRDRATKPLQKIQSALSKITSRTWNVSVKVTDMASKQIKKMEGSLFSLRNMLIGGGTVYAGKQGFDATIGASATMQLAKTQIEALFRDQKKADEYMSRMSKVAIDSPILGEMDIFGKSKSFISLSKDLDLLQKMWKNAEIMAAMDPIQGAEGAVFALRELASGDAISMIERFEMPRKVMNEIKKMDLPQQTEALAKYFKEIGFDQEYLNKVGKTSIGLWTQISEKARKAIRVMGDDGLKKIEPQLERLNEWLAGPAAKRLSQFGSDMIGGFVEGAIAGFDNVKGYIEREYINNPEFQKLDFQGRVSFVSDDLGEKFATWFDEKGAPAMVNYGGKLGASLINSMGSAALAAVQESYLLSLLLGTYLGLKTPGPPQLKLAVILSIVGVQIATDVGAAIGEMMQKYISPHIPGTGKNIEKNIEEHKAAMDAVNNHEGPGPVFKGDTKWEAPKQQSFLEKVGGWATGLFHADGGMFNQTHVGVVAEAGPEAIIPLSPGMRSRGLSLWQQAGQQMGMLPAAAGAGGSGSSIQVYAPVNIQNADKMNLDELTWAVAGQIAAGIKKAQGNRG